MIDALRSALPGELAVLAQEGGQLERLEVASPPTWERRIKAARFPVVKSLDAFDFKVIPSLNAARMSITLGNSGTGKTHIALGLGLAACQKGLSVGFTTAAALVHELIEARDEKQLL